MLLWDGACNVHENFSIEKILFIKEHTPEAKILVHPECKKDVRDIRLASRDLIDVINGMIDLSVLKSLNRLS